MSKYWIFRQKIMTDATEVPKTDIQPESGECEGIEVDFSNAAQKLTIGLLSIYQPPLEQVKRELDELTTKQEVLLNQMQVENKKLSETFEDVDLNEMFNTIRVYQGKLLSMRKEMVNIHERTFRLKKRALRLQQMKQKEVITKEQQREQELRREQELIGKPQS